MCVGIGEESCQHDLQVGEHLKLSCGHKLPVLSAVCSVSKQMPVTEGKIGKTPVSVLRDSGCRHSSCTKEFSSARAVNKGYQEMYIIRWFCQNCPSLQL
ncbi:hypothetical protein HOLleu_39208 [Holothuria leucospilota]|uniref:Uncharacterized protein n=1 Tax=Holothuria leucospilota TaxID=206669 RepID=A0A9Q0YJY3_HOLLE|nr:hypothetical protein HOLleu_39208 [Holothuria leucospilota]